MSTKGFCTLDAGFSDSLLAGALAESMSSTLRRPSEHIVEGLLGNDGSAEITQLELEDDGAAPASAGESLRTMDRAMSNIAAASAPYFPNLGFESSSRTPAVLHLSKTPDSDFGPLGEAEASDWLFEFMRGVVMCLVVIGPDRGTLALQPFEDEADMLELPTWPGMVLVLRSHSLSAVHMCPGNCYVLSCFYLDNRPLSRSEEIGVTPVVERLSEWAAERLDELKTEDTEDRKPDVPRPWLVAMNHQSFKGQHMAVRGASGRFPVTWDPAIWFASLTSGVDYMAEIPLVRWDHGNFYSPEPEMWRAYKTFARHLAFTDGCELFDNKMFSITPAESKVMDPQQRMVLECGYEALYAAGLRKGKIMGSLGGMYLGYGTGTSDYGYVDRSTDSGAEGSFGATGGSAAITANRFSFCLGMKGASIAIDAEDASGLVSAHLGCEGLQRKGRGQVNDFSLVGGIKINLAAFYWPQKQAAGLLAESGRCFTFDESSDGFSFGDGACNLCIRHLIEVVDGTILLREGEPLVGVVAGSSVNCNGRSASMQSPHGPSEQEAISMCVRAASLSGFDVDAAEIHGTSGLIADVVQVSSWSRVLRAACNSAEPLLLTSGPTNMGNGQHAAGAYAMLRAILSNNRGASMANVHLRQVNPYIDAWEGSVAITSEMLQLKLTSSYWGSMARGFAGTNACAVCWGAAQPLRSSPRPENERLTFWPGGGGALDASAQPRKGFHIAGTFTRWSPEPMEMERAGVYGYELILGENRWEQFQVWLDGDPKKCLHPEWSKAPRLTAACGPDAHGHTWLIDGRESDSVDRGLIGAKYRIRLSIAGKYRMVDWERLTGRPEDEQDAPAIADAARSLEPGSYFISADWNGWGFEAMRSSADVHELDVHLTRSGGEFQIVRDRDWDQVFYPDADIVGGPDDASKGRSWNLNGRRGQTFRITFRRENEAGVDVKAVSWEKTGTQDLSETQREAAARTRYAVFGSWNSGTRLRELKWSGVYHYFYLELGATAKESFQLVQDGNWNRIFHPSVADASSGSDHEVVGPSASDGRSCGLNWTVGLGGYEKPGDQFEIRVHDRPGYFGSYVSKVEWSKIPSNRSLREADSEGLVLRRGRR
uniref:Type I polyketide synthase n=1 Tax=Gambierdiscus polynesiensis TaxID=439318 RepID=A0A1S6K853_9DINO|nr:type I polyketide synthase [Gambierdiscus polynesiensis]